MEAVDDWEQRPCRGVDIKVFFPPETNNPNYDGAKFYCERCPFQDTKCLVVALESAEQHGFQANRPADERKQLRRKLAKTGQLKDFLRGQEQRSRITHGLSGWRKGCRCHICRQANREHISKARDKYSKTESSTWKHGKHSTYLNKGCRCDRCKRAHIEAMRDWRDSKRKGGSVDKGRGSDISDTGS